MSHLLETTGNIKNARTRFISMATTYCLGVFNDNYFKQAAMLLAVTLGMSSLQGWATLLFALPFILFSSTAGWVADRFSKKSVVVGSKALECLAMIIGAVGILYGNWTCILGMIFIMGLQSTFFSPALNGSIPELYPPAYVPKANGILKTVSTLSILAGIAAAGITLDSAWPETFILPVGKNILAITIILVSLLGLLASLGIHKRPAANTKNYPFPQYGPISSINDLKEICRDRQQFIAIAADTWFYFIASLVILTINILGLNQLGMSKTATSLMSMSLMLGVCTGSLIIARFTVMDRWSKYLLPASVGMAAGQFLATATILMPADLQTTWLAGSLILSGISAGIFLIPVTSFLQVYPKHEEKGRVLAAANFSGFIGILAAGIIFNLLDSLMSPAKVMAIIGTAMLTVSFMLFLGRNNRIKKIIAILIRIILSLRYDIKVTGLDKIKKDDNRGIVFLPNHPALIDPVIITSALLSKFNPRPLSDQDQANKPFVRQLMKIVDPITIPSLEKNGRNSRKQIKQAIKAMINHLKNNGQILMYPSGRLYRSNKEDLAGNSGVELILRNAPETRIVLVRTKGLWGSSFSLADRKQPSLAAYWKRCLGFFLANLIFFGPKRQVTVELVENTELKKLKNRQAINNYLENFYNTQPENNTHIPYYIWQGTKPVLMPEPDINQINGDIENIPASIQNLIVNKIEELTGLQPEINNRLANDLGADSLMVMELVTWMENEFGISIENIAALETVKDCILAAGGQNLNARETNLKKPSDKWFKTTDNSLSLAGGNSITDLFLNKAMNNPGKTIIADQISGTRTYRDMLAAIFLFKPIMEQIKEDRIGIMLPASATSAILYFAALFSNKTPVMFNWTAGKASMAHGLDQTGVKHIFTAKTLYQRIQGQGTDLSGLKTDWLFLENISASITLKDKLKALTKAVFNPGSLADTPVSKTAAILFTSGSEAQPKAVPLSHDNIIANLKDFSSLIALNDHDKLVGMLPPFHSLGLTGTIILPLCIGLKTVYYANPTESAVLAKIINTYKATALMGTPTFLNGIIQAGTRKQLKTLQLVFTGAEKCPDHVYRTASEIIPQATVCEGYGITECSPLVSLNTIDDNHPGTIGRIMPSLEYAIADLENNTNVKKGRQGILLLRGPSVFKGYLNNPDTKGFHNFQNKLWYNTGDFVKENSDNTLTFCGRKKRFIKLGGEMISLPAIEGILLDKYQDKVKNGSEGPILAIEATPVDEHPEINLFSTFTSNREQINMIIKEAGLSALHNIRSIVQIDEIPVLGTGKTDYKQLRKIIAA